MKLLAQYEKGQVPAGLEGFCVEQDGKMVVQFDDSVALATNPALASKNAELLTEKQSAVTKYNDLVKSSGAIASELNALKVKMAEGGQVTADEISILTALKGIENVTPESVKKILTEHPKLQQQLNALQSDAENRQIGEIVGWKPEVFGKIRGTTKDLKFEIQEITENEKPVKKVYVSYKDGNGADQKKELSEYAKVSDDFAPFLPALQATENRGPEWVQGGPGGGSPQPAKSLIDQRIEEQNQKAKASGNALRPPTPVTPAPAPAQT